MSLYYHFWDCSLYERAAIIEQLLIPASQTLSPALQALAYEKGMQYIANKLFPKANDHSSEDYLALCIMKSYLQTADNFIRSYLLTAMLVSANESAGLDASLGKKLAIVCEHMGPAYVKLAQAIHSHPGISNELRADLAHVKGKANPPHRWSLLRQMSEVLPPDVFANIRRVGRLLGSASYNLALEVILQNNSRVVLLMLRENAEETARKGFAHIRATISECVHESVVRQRMVMTQTIDEAARLSRNEMVKEASDMQASLAEELYPNEMHLQVAGCHVHLSIATARLLKSSHGFRFIDMIDGEEFNSLPDVTAEQRLIKQAVAKAVLTMELHNLLRGGHFDSDRHGNQLRVLVFGRDTGINTLVLQVGLYDFGEMALERPELQGLRQLADVLNRIFAHHLQDKDIDDILSARIDEAVSLNESTHFLMRIRKAFLAMHDFKQYLNRDDLIDILRVVAGKQDIHPELRGPLRRLAVLSTVATAVYSAGVSIATLFGRVATSSSEAAPGHNSNFQPH